MRRAASAFIGVLVLGLSACGGSQHADAPPAATSPTAPTPCSFNVTATDTVVNAVGGTTAVTVTTAPGCRWRPDVLANPWLHVENDAIFAGPATLALTIDGNRSFSGRTGTVAIRDANGEVATSQPLTQRGAGCLYSVEPTARTFDWLGTSDGSDLGLLSLRVHAEPADCRWTATPSVPWILILNRTGSGTGDGDVDVAILHNSLPSGEFPGPRAGQLVVAGLSGVNPDARFTASQQAR